MHMVNLGFINESKLPIQVEAIDSKQDVTSWAKENKQEVLTLLDEHAGILFRGFDIPDVPAFEGFVQGLFENLKGDYGDLPKADGSKKIYKSTPYPDNMKILFHNESSHLNIWPQKQWFFCEHPSKVGGHTPIVDCRKVYEDLSPMVKGMFKEKGLKYIRTFRKRLDVHWSDFYKTDCKAEVEKICNNSGTQFEWFANDVLQTSNLAPAIVNHPKTNELSFFNQVQLHHPSYLDPSVREMLVEMYGENKLPRNVLFGDGTKIPDEVLEEVNACYDKHAIRFDWQQGDILMLDNMLIAHARDEFEGKRKIGVAMGDMFQNITD
ncbi:hypothetical protein PCIT_a3825 [Pseudoalteromonas citrea]|uniref:TauD/TfdA-like domain-containing protein n=2 Tax=Pseudoalteromonas citrea TaxID=43655 RepID=A0AAD4AGH8_9GAMM|nr:TauD/TfdA family dioxygenase [Pseudoalteromonas citrea]KAF7767738.1 hypothetical protein PCIT_a3825 [Pseudoalteromonas citrea]